MSAKYIFVTGGVVSSLGKGLGGWPNLSLQTTLQGAPLKLRLGGDVQLSQNFSRLPTKLAPCLGDSNTFNNPGNLHFLTLTCYRRRHGRSCQDRITMDGGAARATGDHSDGSRSRKPRPSEA